MKERKNFLIFLMTLAVILIFSFQNSSAYNIIGNGTCTCNNCSDCTNALNDNTNCYEKIRLTKDILNYYEDYIETCIQNPENFSNKIFDCGGHRIHAFGVIGDKNEVYMEGKGNGIYLENKSGDTIKNCVVTGFYYGIYLSSSLNNTLTDNTVYSNKWYGIYLYNSSNNVLINNIVNLNNYYLRKYYGIYLSSSSNNNLINNTANSNKVGIYLGDFSNYNILVGNILDSNENTGIFLSHSFNNTLINNTVNLSIYGVYLYLSSNNDISSNKLFKNKYDIKILDGERNVGDNKCDIVKVSELETHNLWNSVTCSKNSLYDINILIILLIFLIFTILILMKWKIRKRIK